MKKLLFRILPLWRLDRQWLEFWHRDSLHFKRYICGQKIKRYWTVPTSQGLLEWPHKWDLWKNWLVFQIYYHSKQGRHLQ